MNLKYPSQPMRIARALLCSLFIALHGPAALAAGGVLGNVPETTAPVYSVSGGTPMVMLTMARAMGVGPAALPTFGDPEVCKNVAQELLVAG